MASSQPMQVDRYSGYNHRPEDRPTYHYPNQTQYQPPQPIEPARPLEPRPAIQTTLSDPHASIPIRVAQPGQLPSLPGIRDFMSSTRLDQPGYSPLNTANSQMTGPHTQQHHRRPSDHYPPPVPLQYSAESSAGYPPKSINRYDTPHDQARSDSDYHRQPASTSPYSAYSDPRNHSDNRNGRQGHATNGPIISSTENSPYTGSNHGVVMENGHPRPHPHAGIYERNVNGQNLAAAGAENGRKYIGVETTAEGTFHCYEGGFRLPTHVDGEQVNPAWGLTKANKPRKRLALACLDCREKKIKCEPGTNSCVQCEKAKRTCRKAPQQTQDDYPTGTPWSASSATMQPNGEHVVPQAAPPNLETLSTKRAIDVVGVDTPTPMKKPYSPHALIGSAGSSPNAHGVSVYFPSNATSGTLNIDDDPYAVYPDLTMHLVQLYFAYSECYRVFPRQHFMRWLTTQSAKTQTERIVLYALLAFASSFASSSAPAENSLMSFGSECARTASDALLNRLGRHKASLALARLLLGLYTFAKGSREICYDHLGAAVTTVMYLRLCTEQGCKDHEDGGSRLERLDFDFKIPQLTEYRRRIFWAIFVIERHGASVLCMLKPEDVFLRLPCNEEAFEQGLESNAPLLDNGITSSAESMLEPGSPAAPAAWMIAVSSLVGEVLDFVDRAIHRDFSTYMKAYEPFYAEITSRVRLWCKQLPPFLRFSQANLDQSIQLGYSNVFIAMHTMHHYLVMRLNRCVRHKWLPPASLARNLQTANAHGYAMLRLLQAVSNARRDLPAITYPGDPQPRLASVAIRTWLFSTSFVGPAAVMAVDIVTAGGHEKSIPPARELVKVACECLREMTQSWTACIGQFKACERRFYQIINMVDRPGRTTAGAWLRDRWGLEKPIHGDIPDFYDCIYGIEDFNVYHNAIDNPGAVPGPDFMSPSAAYTDPQRW